MFFVFFTMVLIGLFIGVINKKCLMNTINNRKLSKNFLLLSSFLRILLVSLILFFIIKIDYRFIVPLFIGFSLSRFFIKKIRIKNEH